LAIGGEVAAHARREGDDPLAIVGPGQDAIAKVGSGIVHAPCGTRRARAAAVAGERDQVFESALGADEAGEAAAEDTAVEESLELAADVCGQAVSEGAALGEPGVQRIELAGDESVKDGLLRLAATIDARRGGG